jgi:cysteine-rich repeat protein
LLLITLLLVFAGCHAVLSISKGGSETCGNGVLDPEETCDPGAAGPQDGCAPDCSTVAGWRCEGEPSVCEPICGDGLLVGDEECENGDPGDATCENTGNGSGTLTCSDQCRLDASQCIGFVSVSCGADHACAQLSSGRVACWGGNATGQIGDGTGTERLLPVFLDSLNRVQSLRAADGLTCALSDMAQRDEVLVYCWGDNADGGLGVGDQGLGESRVPMVLPWFEDLAPEEAGVLGGMGGHFCAALSGNGSSNLRCWGDNAAGQLGDGTTEDRGSPVAVEGLYASVCGGGAFTCGLTAGGSVRCWGLNDEGQLGIGSSQSQASPAEVTLTAEAQQLTCGLAHACALLVTGEIACWGRNAAGQLGDGTSVQREAPVVIPGISGATSVSAGHAHSCAVTDPGTIQCWGSNENGQLGDGTHKPGTPTPQPVIFE